MSSSTGPLRNNLDLPAALLDEVDARVARIRAERPQGFGAPARDGVRLGVATIEDEIHRIADMFHFEKSYEHMGYPQTYDVLLNVAATTLYLLADWHAPYVPVGPGKVDI